MSRHDQSTAELQADVRDLRRRLAVAEEARAAAEQRADRLARELDSLRQAHGAQAQALAEARTQVEQLGRALRAQEEVTTRCTDLSRALGESAALILSNHIARLFDEVGPERIADLQSFGSVPAFVVRVEYEFLRLRQLPAEDAEARKRHVDLYWRYRRQNYAAIALICKFPSGSSCASLFGWGPTRSEPSVGAAAAPPEGGAPCS